MKILYASVLLAALFSGPAFAQMPALNLLQDDPTKTPEQIEKDKATERAYKDTLRKIPDAHVSNDPWGGVRTENQPKAVVKPKAKHTANAPAKPKAQ